MGANSLPAVVAATERATIGISLVDADCKYTWVNEAFCALLGYTRTQLLGRSPFEFTHPDDVDLDRELSEQAFRGEIPHFQARKRYTRRDGSIFVGDLLASVFFEDGVALGGYSVLVDASQTDPTTQRIESLQRSAAIGQVTAAAVHDLRNNIAAVGLVGDALEAQFGLLPAIELLKYEVEGTHSLLSSIMGYVRPDEPTGSWETIGTVVAQAHPLLRLAVPARINFDVLLTEPDITATIEARELQQVITNLVLNARDAVVSEGGRISLTAGATIGDAECVDIIVSDNGSGMTPEELEQAFDPYFTTKGENGTGLGLTICRDIIERNGGRLLVESTPGEGATFTIRLPQSIAVHNGASPGSLAVAESG